MTKLGKLFRRNDEAVTEVIGYVLSFALSAVFLLIALNVFHAARGNTEEVVTGVELKTIADRVASRVVELGFVSQEFENATMNVTMNIPQMLAGRLYEITIAPDDKTIIVATDDGALSASSTTYRTEVLPNIQVSGSADSSNERVIIQYDRVDSTRHITITGG